MKIKFFILALIFLSISTFINSQSKYGKKQTLSYRLPSILLTGQYVHLNQDIGIDLNYKKSEIGQKLMTDPALGQILNSSPILKQMAGYVMQNPGVLGDWSHTFQKQNVTSVDLLMTYPIFTGGKINAGVKAGKIKEKIENSEIKAEEDKLLSQLTQYYFQVQLAQEAVKVRKEAYNVTKQHLNNAKLMVKNGMIAEVEMLQAQAAFADAERELLSSKKDLELAQTALAGILGVDECTRELNTKMFLSDKLKKLDYYQEEAKLHYPDLEKLYLSEELSIQNIKAKRSSYMPTIALLGQKHLYTDNFPLSKQFDWFVGVGIKFSIFDGLKRHNEIREAKALNKSLQYLKKQATSDIQVLVRKNYQEILKQKELAASLDKDLKFADELFRARTKAFKQGLATSTNVIDAALYRSAIKLKKLKALYEFDMYLASILEICGQSAEFDNYITK